ncbi:MAG: hypothetical protein R6V41_06105 [Desulfobacteraceae bacterium]
MIPSTHKTLQIVFCSVFIMAAVLLAGAEPASAGSGKELVNCDIQNRPCTRQAFGGTVTLDILPRPVKAMDSLTFRVKLEGIEIEKAPFIDLGMPGMNMGPNRVDMEQYQPGAFEGTGVIVRCPSGKTIWRAYVNLPEKGTVDFIFDVVH